MLIQYIGRKPMKTDVVANTGVVWVGHGDIQEVPDAAAPKLLAYVDIWRKADEGSAAFSPPLAVVTDVDINGDGINLGHFGDLDLDAPIDPDADDQNKPPMDIADTLIDEARADYLKRAEAIGLEVSPRWGIPRLAKEVERAEAAKG
jgi:hypothetical protein